MSNNLDHHTRAAKLKADLMCSSDDQHIGLIAGYFRNLAADIIVEPPAGDAGAGFNSSRTRIVYKADGEPYAGDVTLSFARPQEEADGIRSHVAGFRIASLEPEKTAKKIADFMKHFLREDVQFTVSVDIPGALTTAPWDDAEAQAPDPNRNPNLPHVTKIRRDTLAYVLQAMEVAEFQVESPDHQPDMKWQDGFDGGRLAFKMLVKHIRASADSLRWDAMPSGERKDESDILMVIVGEAIVGKTEADNG